MLTVVVAGCALVRVGSRGLAVARRDHTNPRLVRVRGRPAYQRWRRRGTKQPGVRYAFAVQRQPQYSPASDLTAPLGMEGAIFQRPSGDPHGWL